MMSRSGPLIAFCLIGSLLIADETDPQHEYFSHYGQDRGEPDQDK
jgi:hypothetical protein